MTWGDEKTLKTLETHYENTGVMPPSLASRPELLLENVVYNEAFNTLSSGRQNTDHVINPITFSDVMQYCDCIGEFSGYERLRYWHMVSSCDASFIGVVLDKRSEESRRAALKK